MNRSDLVPSRNNRPIAATLNKRPIHPGSTIGISFDALIRSGCEITRQIALAEKKGDFRKVEQLLHQRDQLHRLRKELSDASR